MAGCVCVCVCVCVGGAWLGVCVCVCMCVCVCVLQRRPINVTWLSFQCFPRMLYMCLRIVFCMYIQMYNIIPNCVKAVVVVGGYGTLKMKKNFSYA